MNTPFASFRSIRIQKGLSLEERIRMVSLYARASVKGKQHYFNTETADFRRAERLALSWFQRLQRDDTKESGSVAAAYEQCLTNIGQKARDSRSAKQNQQNCRDKWSVLRPYLAGVEPRDITTKWLRALVAKREQDAERRSTTISRSTLHKDLLFVRGVLNAAKEEGWIEAIPDFPSLGKHHHNPRPWLEPDEWKHLQKIARARIKEPDQNPRSRQQREELYDFCLFMIHTCARVDEARRVKVGDCIVKTSPKKGSFSEYLELRIHGKTGLRKSIGWSGAVIAYRRCVARRSLSPTDLLFTEHHRDGFRELLEAASLRTNAEGKTRNLKSLRCSALAFRIIRNPRINLTLLARQAGTSVQMLDQFYLKPLSVDVAIEELL